MNVGARYGSDPGAVFRTAVMCVGAVACVALILVAAGPIQFAGVAVAFFAAAFALRFGARIPVLFLSLMLCLLVGYAFFGRSFAYLGVAPVYVGEITLAIGIVSVLASGRLGSMAALPQTWLLAALAVWCALQTVPYIGTYGADALRDAALWGYGVFAIAIATALLASDRLRQLVTTYGRTACWFVAWVPVAWVITQLVGDRLPEIVAGVPLLTVKMGDAAVHLTGAAAFMLTLGRRAGISARQSWIFWTVWLVSFLCVLSQNRGGSVAVIAGLAVVAMLIPFARKRLLLGGAAIAVAGGLVLAVASTADADLQFGPGPEGRNLSPSQITANIVSLVNTQDSELAGTREWRLDWWRTIAAYTFEGPYFWTGKGFGINLADDDGFQVGGVDNQLRSPHSAHMTFLARAGVPGLALWIALQVVFAAGLLRAFFVARRAEAWDWALLDVWVLAYWTAFQVNASFDVFLEGPQGGIWFWSLFGIGLAALVAQRGLPERSAHGAAA